MSASACIAWIIILLLAAAGLIFTIKIYLLGFGKKKKKNFFIINEEKFPIDENMTAKEIEDKINEKLKQHHIETEIIITEEKR